MIPGAIDLHVHCAPDVRPRKTTALELARAARDAGMAGLLLKNHEWSTVALAATVEEAVPGIRVAGGLVLNEAVGGFNPVAVEKALGAGAKQIWMPTHCAEGERRHHGRSGLTLESAGAALEEILRLIASGNAILGTAHLSADEIVELVARARAAGVRKILVTHPEIRYVNLPLETQRALAGPDLFFERCYARPPLFALDWDGLAHSVREIGAGSTVLATDLGQPGNPHPVEGLAEMARQFAARGFSDAELRRMLCENPAYLLDW